MENDEIYLGGKINRSCKGMHVDYKNEKGVRDDNKVYHAGGAIY